MGALAALVWFADGRYALKAALGWITGFLGLATVLCMAQVYLLPTQIAWNSAVTILSYYGEAALLGATSLSAILLMDLNFMYEQGSEAIKDHERMVAAVIKRLIFASVIAMIANLALNAEQILFLSALQNESAQMSMRLLSDLYQPLYLVRLGMTVIGVSWLLVSYFRISKIKGQIRRLIIHAYVASTLVLIGEVLGRFLFYAIHVRSGI
jgi:DMSO reductase anchor subunit